MSSFSQWGKVFTTLALIVFISAASQCLAEDLAAQFANPPSEARILKIIHNWPDQFQAQDGLIRNLTNQGFGGVVCNVSFENYLESESNWQAFTRAINAAKKAGMTLWLYDEKGYPSANAGGIVMRDHPEWEAHGLLIADTDTRGGAVFLDVPAGKIMLAAAYPVVNGLIEPKNGRPMTNSIAKGKLKWQAPRGEWHVMVITEDALFEGTHAAMNLHAKIPYPNLLLPEVTQRFVEVTHGEYARRLGNDLGKFFESTFTDEPSLMSCFLRPMPYRVLPWAQNLPNEFQKRRGYTLESILPLLVAEAGSASQKARYDFWLTIGELVAQNYFGQIQEWCSKHHLRSGGHLLSEESIVTHVPFYGDFFRCIRRLDAPSVDILTSLPPEVPWYIARLLASAAELEGKTLVMSETSDHSQRYRPAGDKRAMRVVTEDEIRGTCNRIFVGGVNTITSYYSYADLTDDQLRRLNEWVGRCCLMLRGGQQVADIAVLYPVESIWPCFVPSRQWANDADVAARIENTYRSVSETLFAARRDFTYVDSRALTEAKAIGGELVHGQLRWRIVVLPKADTLPLAAWENLAAFVKEGGVVIAAGALPENSEREFPSPRVQAIAKQIFGSIKNEPAVFANQVRGAGVFLPEGSESLLIGLLNQRLEPDVATSERRAPLRVTHRRKDGQELYFVINDGPDLWQGEIGFRVAGSGERLDPGTGQRESLPSSERYSLRLGPYHAAFFRFPEARTPKVTPLKSGSLPGLTLEALPSPTAKVNGGEFVRQELTTNSVAINNVGGWRALGTITKSQVDTHLFLRLQFPAGLDLTGCDSLLLETSVPEGQRVSAQLLVILHEKDGSDYLAQTGRSLAAAGRSKIFVPINRFQLAGWSKDENAKLDLNNVDEIRIGWGGYFGTEGERIEFSVTPPQAAKESW